MPANVWEYLNTNANAGGITTIATIVLAFANIMLVILTGCYVVITRRQAKHLGKQAEVTAGQSDVMKQQTDQLREQVRRVSELVGETAKQSLIMKQQASQLREQDQRRVKRAIQAIVTEIEVNAQWAELEKPSPFLCEAYSTHLWVLGEVGMSLETSKAIALANLSVKSFNVEYLGDTMGRVRGESMRVWELAVSAIRAALEAMKSDQELRRLLGE